MAIFPPKMAGFGGALKEAYPLLLAMSQGMRTGQGPFAYAPQGLASMMAMQDKRKAEAEQAAAKMEEQAEKAQAQQMMTGFFSNMAPQSTPAPMSEAAAIGNDTMAALGLPPNRSPLPPSLIASESGGRLTAQNDVKGSGGVGHFGRGQFSHGRLEDAKRAGVVPASMTPEQYMASEEAQRRVEQWHVGDILEFSKSNGIDRMIGQQINGIPITRDGIINVAHLGGKGGLKRFIDTNGAYDPADANGTKLSDYLAMGAGISPKPKVDPNRVAQIMASERVPASVKQIVMAQYLQQTQGGERDLIEINGQLVDKNTGQVFGDYRNEKQEKDPAAELKISRIMETHGVDRKTAVGLVDGVVVVSRHPQTGEATLIDRITGEIVGGAQPQPGQPQPGQQPNVPLSFGEFGQPYQGAGDAFGLEGFGKGALNTAADVVGAPVPFPQVQAAQTDFAVLGEALTNDLMGAYDQRLPASLINGIRELTPKAGKVFSGPGDAVAKLNSLGRSFQQELINVQEQLANRQLSPTNKQNLEARASALQSALGRVTAAKRGFSSGEVEIRPEVADRLDAYK